MVYKQGARTKIKTNPIPDTDAAVAHTGIVTNVCEYYNTTCNGVGHPGCMEVEQCPDPKEGHHNFCYVLWSIEDDGAVNVSLKVEASVRVE